jgi:hypothetical protein
MDDSVSGDHKEVQHKFSSKIGGAMSFESLFFRVRLGYARSMRRWLKLTIALLVFVPAWTILGGLSPFDSGLPLWWGLSIGASIGLFFGFVFGGNHKWRVWDYIYGPEDPNWKDD